MSELPGMQEAAEYAKNQPPLNRVYETSDFAQGIAQGRYLERERIIKLLEAKDCGDDFCIHDECIFAIETIEIIKGENK
jgi:hypothetical protein